MSRNVRTARGKSLDMSTIAAKNETVKAVGNVLMNARGDRLNPDGSVRITVEQMARLDQDRKTPPKQVAISDPVPVTANKPVEQSSAEIELDLEPISKITKTREDGTRYVEIEYNDGSVETKELSE